MNVYKQLIDIMPLVPKHIKYLCVNKNGSIVGFKYKPVIYTPTYDKEPHEWWFSDFQIIFEFLLSDEYPIYIRDKRVKFSSTDNWKDCCYKITNKRVIFRGK